MTIDIQIFNTDVSLHEKRTMNFIAHRNRFFCFHFTDNQFLQNEILMQAKQKKNQIVIDNTAWNAIMCVCVHCTVYTLLRYASNENLWSAHTMNIANSNSIDTKWDECVPL